MELSRLSVLRGARLISPLLCCNLIAASAWANNPGAIAQSDLVLWLDANDTTTLFQNSAGTTPVTADDQLVSYWADKSGKNNNAVVEVNPATFNSDAANLINGNNTLKFDSVDGVTGSVFKTPLDITRDATEDVTIFTVYRPRSTVLNGQGQAIWGNDNLNWDRFYYSLFESAGGIATDNVDDGLISLGGASQGQIVDGAGLVDQVYLMTAQYDGLPYSDPDPNAKTSAIFFNGDLQVSFKDQSNNDAFNNFYVGWDGNNSPYDGDLAEIIVYDRTLTDCEMFRLNNYLSNKYGENFLNAGSNYDFSGSHPEDIAAISVYVDDPSCSFAALNEITSGALTVNNPSSNDQYKTFLRFGHDAGGFGASANVPNNNYIRLQQSWAVDEDIDPAESSTDIGTVDLTFDTSSFGIAPAALDSDFALLIDTDSDFSDATLVTNPGTSLTYDASADTVVIEGWDPVDGAVITLASLKASTPEVTINSPQAGVEGSSITFTVSTVDNAPVNGPVTLSYSFANVSTSNADFTSGNTSGTVTIADGQSSATIVMATSDDADATEAAETFTLTLDAVTLGLATIASGSNVGTGTIRDNDPSAATAVEIQDGGDGIINAAERSGGVDVRVSLPADAVAGDIVELDLNNDDVADVQATLGAVNIAAGNITVLIPEVQTPTTGTLTVDARIVDAISGNTGSQVRDTASLDTSVPGAPTSLAIQDGGDGRINAAERVGGVDAIVGLPANAVAGDTVALDFNGDDIADLTATITAANDAANAITILIPEVQVPTSGTLTVDASIVDPVGNKSGETQDTSLVDITAPDAPTSVAIQDGGDGFINAAERTGGVNVVVGLPANAVAGDTLALDLNGDNTADVAATITAADDTADTITVLIPEAQVPASGTLTVDANIVDVAGNEGNDLRDTSLVDTATPDAPTSVAIQDGGDGFINAAERVGGVNVVVGLPANAVAGDTVALDLNGDNNADVTATITPANDAANSVTVLIPEAQVPTTGTLTVDASIVDAAGNEGGEVQDTALVFLDTDGDGTADQDEPTAGISDPCLPSNTVAPCDSDNDGLTDGEEIADGSDPNSDDSDGDGVKDDVESSADSDGDGLIDRKDPDSDNDGIPDTNEVGDMPDTPRDSDNDGVIDMLDRDSDNDGIPDVVEGSVDADGDGLGNQIDADSDNDGLPDTVEDNIAVGTDSDSDGIDDAYDVDQSAGSDANNDGVDDNLKPLDSDGDTKPNYIDIDSDNDGIPDTVEANLNVINDLDGDQINDEYDVDSTGGVDANNDGVDDALMPPNSDGDPTPDYLDIDSDNDTLLDVIEAGGDDEDSNGVIDDLANNEGSLTAPTDSDLDGNGDWREVDSDNDGNFDIEDSPFARADANNDGVVDNETDTDGDGFVELADRFNGFGNTPDSDGDGIFDDVEGNEDTDGDGLPDYNDPDSDNDGINDEDEVGSDPTNPADFDRDGTPNYKDDDSDNDGIDDALEGNADLNNNGKPDYLDADGELETALEGSGAGSIEWGMLLVFGLLALMRKHKFKSAAALKALLVAPLALVLPLEQVQAQDQAQEQGKSHCDADQYAQLEDKDWSCWYVGAGLGYSYVAPDGEARNFFHDNSENHDWGLNVYLGRMLSEHWFAEFKYADLGEAGLTNRNPAVAAAFPDAAITYDVPSLMAGYQWRPEHALKPFAKFGLAVIANDATGGPVPYDQKTSTQLAFALGVKYQKDDSPWFGRFETDFYDKDAWYAGLSIGRVLSFGSASRKAVIEEPVVEHSIAEAAAEPVAEPLVKTVVEPVVKTNVEAAVETTAEPVVETIVALAPVVLDSDKDGVPDDADKCPATAEGLAVDAQGCVSFEEGIDVAIVDISFAVNSAALSSKDKAKLDEFAQAFAKYPTMQVEVQAHSDSSGSAKYNQKLSQRRAESVMAYLAERGVTAERMQAKGCGESKPRATNDTAAGRAKNRRVEFVVLSR